MKRESESEISPHGKDARMGLQDHFPRQADFEDDIPTIDDGMLHPDVDFEAGMSAVPVVSLMLMAACVAAFAVEAGRGVLNDARKLTRIGALSRAEVEAGEVWRTVSAMFLHGGVDHLIGNLVILYIMGIACEHAFGRFQFLTLYVLAGMVGSLWSLSGRRLSVGASGAIFGLVGSMIMMLWRHRARLHVRDRRIGGVLALWAAYQLGLGYLNPNVDNLAHLGGLIGGAALGFVLRPAVLEGRGEVAARPATVAGFLLTCAILLGTALFFVPRLVE